MMDMKKYGFLAKLTGLKLDNKWAWVYNSFIDS